MIHDKDLPAPSMRAVLDPPLSEVLHAQYQSVAAMARQNANLQGYVDEILTYSMRARDLERDVGSYEDLWESRGKETDDLRDQVQLWSNATKTLWDEVSQPGVTTGEAPFMTGRDARTLTAHNGHTFCEDHIEAVADFLRDMLIESKGLRARLTNVFASRDCGTLSDCESFYEAIDRALDLLDNPHEDNANADDDDDDLQSALRRAPLSLRKHVDELKATAVQAREAYAELKAKTVQAQRGVK